MRFIPLKATVFGLGSIGMRHARNLKSLGVENVAGMDPNAGRRQRFLDEHGGETAETIEEALSSPPDLAVIASPNRFHVEQANACARIGCHLLIEKPLGSDVDGVDELISEIEAQGLFAHVGSNWKFHAAFAAMKRLLDERRVGQVTGAQVLAGQWLPDWHPWEDFRKGYSARADLGGGVVLDSHELDYLTWLLGPVRETTGMTAHSGALDIETEDVAAICLRFESGALATLQLDYIQREYRRRYHISGDAGTIEWDVRSGVVNCYRAETGRTETIETPLGDVNDMYVAQMQHVLDGVRGGVAPVTPVAVAAKVLAMQIALRDRPRG